MTTPIQMEFGVQPYKGLPPFEKGSDTSHESAIAALPYASILRGKIFQYICEAGGSTCSEVEVGMGLSHQSASARIRELVLTGHLRDSGIRRKTLYGRNAAVWVRSS